MPALPFVPEILGILWALLITIFAFIGLRLLAPLFGELGKALAWAPGFVVDRLNDAQNAIVAFFVRLMPDAVGTLINLITTAVGLSRGVSDAIAAAIDSAFNAIAYVTQHAIPWLMQRIQDVANGTVAWAIAQFQRLEALLDWRIRALLATVLALLQAGIASAVAGFNQQFKGLEDAIGGLWAAVVAVVAGALNAARAYTDQRVRQAEVTAASAVGTAAADAIAADQALRQRIDEAARNAEAFAAGLSAGVRNAANLGDARTLAAALTATGAVAIGLEAIRELECIKRCGPLGQLGNDLEALDLGLLLAVLVGAATHPKEAAGAVQGLLGPGATFAHDELRGLLGR